MTTWALSNAWGVNRDPGDRHRAPTADFIFAATDTYVGSAWSSIMQILVVTSFLAMLLGFHNLFARYVFALGRARMLPATMGVADRRSGSPRRAALAIGIVELVVIGAFLLFGADAYTVLYAWLIALGTVTLLVVLALTSVAILVFFARTRVESGRRGDAHRTGRRARRLHRRDVPGDRQLLRGCSGARAASRAGSCSSSPSWRSPAGSPPGAAPAAAARSTSPHGSPSSRTRGTYP